jgi:hypothetical protein
MKAKHRWRAERILGPLFADDLRETCARRRSPPRIEEENPCARSEGAGVLMAGASQVVGQALKATPAPPLRLSKVICCGRTSAQNGLLSLVTSTAASRASGSQMTGRKRSAWCPWGSTAAVARGVQVARTDALVVAHAEGPRCVRATSSQSSAMSFM